MGDRSVEAPEVNIDTLREAIQEEYAEVAANLDKGFHFPHRILRRHRQFF